jgi:hypothetical protein
LTRININPCKLLLPVILLLSPEAKSQLTVYGLQDLHMIYPGKDISYLVPHTGRCFTNAIHFHKLFWDYTPSDPVNILFNDFTDVGNGGATVIPRNLINIAVAPLDYTFDVLPANERLQWLMSHEICHIVMCDKASNADRIFHYAFLGKVMPEQDNPCTLLYSYLTTPRWYCPRWYHEGIATFMETWMSGGMGRVLGNYDEMVFRTMVSDSAYFYRPVGLESEGTTVDFQVGANAYLYGTRFVSFLAYQHGVSKLKEFYSRTDTSRRFFARQFCHVYGKSLSDEWEDWIKWEKDHQKNNLSHISKYPVTVAEPITKNTLGSVSRMYLDKNKRVIYTTVNYPRKLAHICSISLNDGQMKKICTIPSPNLYSVTSLAYDPGSETLFFTDKNNYWRGLCKVSTITGKTETLISYLRAGDLVFNNVDMALYAIQTISGRVSIIRITQPYSTFSQIYNLPFGKSLFNLDVSHDGSTLSATMADINGKQEIVLFDLHNLLQGKNEYRSIYEFEDNSASNFVFSDDDKFMYGTSYYNGVSNIYNIGIESKKASLLTNALTGYFRPVEINPDSLLALEYHNTGLLPVKMKKQYPEDVNAIDFLGQKVFQKNPEVEQWMLPPLSEIVENSTGHYERPYHPSMKWGIQSAYPILTGYKNKIVPGYCVQFSDDIGLNHLKFILGYSSASESENYTYRQMLHAGLSYTLWSFTLTASYNKSDFYDLFGPNKISRAGYSTGFNYSFKTYNLLPFTWEIIAQANAYWQLEKLPAYQNIDASSDKLYTVMVMNGLSRLLKSLGATDYEQGYQWKTWFQGNMVDGKFFPGVLTSLNLGLLLPWKNSSIWLKSFTGQGFTRRDNPFGNYYFGSFGYNLVDVKSGSRLLARELWAFPGIGIDEVSGRNFLKINPEIHLPPVRYKKTGVLGCYMTYSRLILFGYGLATNLDAFNDNNISGKVASAGIQADSEIVLFSLMKSTFSFGYAHAFWYKGNPDDGWFISLRIM